ncbi:hypothetical protein HG530_009708 [Fusarium avenaceum]|nr:hypothetical protein HG530_009708 [Fusarium avenaceum]
MGFASYAQWQNTLIRPRLYILPPIILAANPKSAKLISTILLKTQARIFWVPVLRMILFRHILTGPGTSLVSYPTETKGLTYPDEDITNENQGLCALESLVKVDLLVVEDAVANLAQNTLNLELAPPPCGSKDLACHTSLVLSTLLVSPVLATLLLHLGHVFHSLLSVDGTADGVPCFLDEGALVAKSAEEATNTKELLAAEEA